MKTGAYWFTIRYPIEILSLRNYNYRPTDLYIMKGLDCPFILLELFSNISLHLYLFNLNWICPLCGDASAWAPNASTCQQNRPQPNATKSDASELNQSKPKQTKANPTAAATTTCTSTRVDPNQIPNLILCLCHHSSSAQRSVAVGGGGEVGVAPFGSPNS